jgi:Pyruvate/2-oxoacid:ferredoxin oxidoreductase delta subunit
MSEKFWYKVSRSFIKAGKLPIAVTDTVIEILKNILTEEQANFILLLKKPSYSIDQLKDLTDLDDEALNKMLNNLMQLGVVTGIPSRSTGIMVYRLIPFLPGLVETTFMKGEISDKHKKLAKLYDDLFNDFVKGTQKNYEQMVSEYKKGPALTRIIPIETEIETKQEIVLPFEEISKIVEKYDVIGLATCYCRHRKDLLEEPCKKTNERQNCLSFGKTADFFISQDFAKRISKEEAIKILKKAEDDGLVHKAFHTNLDLEKDIDGLCNCCKCCCGTFDAHYAGAWPIMDYTSYLAEVDQDKCVGCGTCVQNCNAEAIELVDTVAQILEDRCIGCGICAHLCPENAMKLNRTEPRKVFVPPPKLINA